MVVRKGDDGCFARISRRNGIVKWNMVSAREWLLPTAARCWLAEEQRVENVLPIKRGHHRVALFCRQTIGGQGRGEQDGMQG